MAANAEKRGNGKNTTKGKKTPVKGSTGKRNITTENTQKSKKSSEEELSKVCRNDGKTYIFGGVKGRRVDLVSHMLGRWLTHQSERDIPRVHFTKGIMSTAK